MADDVMKVSGYTEKMPQTEKMTQQEKMPQQEASHAMDRQRKKMQQQEASEAMSRREKVGGFRVPKGTDDEQTRYKTAVATQRLAAKTEPVESLMERYGLDDPYLAGLYKNYQSAPSSEMKTAYGEMIRKNVNATVADRLMGEGNTGDAIRMAQAINEKTDDLKSKVLPSTVED